MCLPPLPIYLLTAPPIYIPHVICWTDFAIYFLINKLHEICIWFYLHVFAEWLTIIF